MVSINLLGQIHEDAAMKAIGGDAENLNNNDKLKDIKLKGNNYPVYDIFSSTEVCSVKVRSTDNGEANIQSYKQEYSKMLGLGRAYDRGLSPIQQDAERIIECGKLGLPIPKAIRDAKPEKVVSYLKEYSIMRVPSDHVEAVRSALISDAKRLPENYFLPINPTEKQLRNLADRIQSTGISYSESIELANSPQYKNRISEKIVNTSNAFTARSQQEEKMASREKTNAFTKAIKSYDCGTKHNNSLSNPKDKIEESTQNKSTGNLTQDNLKKSR